MQSNGIRGLFLSGGFAFITYLIYQNPPVGGIFWLLPLAFTFFFLSTTLSRFVQAGMIKKLLRETAQPAALPDREPDYLQPPRSIYETDELAQPRSVTDAGRNDPGGGKGAAARHIEMSQIDECLPF